jgi:hypothetical protein
MANWNGLLVYTSLSERERTRKSFLRFWAIFPSLQSWRLLLSQLYSSCTGKQKMKHKSESVKKLQKKKKDYFCYKHCMHYRSACCDIKLVTNVIVILCHSKIVIGAYSHLSWSLSSVTCISSIALCIHFVQRDRRRSFSSNKRGTAVPRNVYQY